MSRQPKQMNATPLQRFAELNKEKMTASNGNLCSLHKVEAPSQYATATIAVIRFYQSQLVRN